MSAAVYDCCCVQDHRFHVLTRSCVVRIVQNSPQSPQRVLGSRPETALAVELLCVANAQIPQNRSEMTVKGIFIHLLE